MKKSNVFILLAAIFLVACNSGKVADADRLQHENDSLMQVNAEIANNYEEMIAFLTQIDTDLQMIKMVENYVIEQRNDTGEITVSVQSRIVSDIELISSTLERNRQRLAEMEQKLNKSNLNSKSLQEAIEQLKSQIAEKDKLIIELQESLAARDVRIAELDETVAGLSVQVEDLTAVRDEQEAVIASQDAALNEVFYVYAYTDQLREHNILTGGGLFNKTQVMKEDFDKSFFTPADMRTLNTIFLESKKVKVCTSHPNGSYELVKDNDGYYTLNILDPDKFWSLSRFLVVELK